MSASSVTLSGDSPATVPTGVDVWLAGRATVTSPWSGLVAAVSEHEVVVAGEDGSLHVRGEALVPGGAALVGHAVAAGDELGSATGRVWVQLRSDSEVPAFVRPEYAPG